MTEIDDRQPAAEAIGDDQLFVAGDQELLAWRKGQEDRPAHAEDGHQVQQRDLPRPARGHTSEPAIFRDSDVHRIGTDRHTLDDLQGRSVMAEKN